MNSYVTNQTTTYDYTYDWHLQTNKARLASKNQLFRHFCHTFRANDIKIILSTVHILNMHKVCYKFTRVS